MGAKHVLVENLHRDLVDERVRNPSSVVAVGDLTELVGADLSHRDLVGLRVVLNRDLCGHSTHSGDSPPICVQ